MNKILPKSLYLLISLLISSCDSSQQLPYVKLTGFTMGTTYHITLQSQPDKLKDIQQKIDQRLVEINQLMSTYIDDSELSLFNQFQKEKCFPLSQETLKVIKAAVDISKETNGKFDVTLGPLISEWGFDKKLTHDVIPSEQTVQNLLQSIGYKNLVFAKQCIKKNNPLLTVNLSAIAKGYGVDEIAKLIEENNITNYLVEIGGETASKGLNPKLVPWRLAIEVPTDQARQIQQIFTPNGLGVATSGDYRNYFEKDGVRFSHTLDPTTGKPITHKLVSVTVLHHQTMLADALATAFMVMGPVESKQYADDNNLAIYLIIKNSNGFEAVYTKAFETHLLESK